MAGLACSEAMSLKASGGARAAAEGLGHPASFSCSHEEVTSCKSEPPGTLAVSSLLLGSHLLPALYCLLRVLPMGADLVSEIVFGKLLCPTPS